MDDAKTEQTIPEVPRGLLALGSVLILSGVFGAFFIGREALSVYRKMGDHSFVGGLIDRLGDTSVFVFGDDQLTVTEQGATIITFVLFIMIALLGTHIAIAFIRAGAHIVSPVFPYQLAQLKLHVARIREKVGNR